MADKPKTLEEILAARNAPTQQGQQLDSPPDTVSVNQMLDRMTPEQKQRYMNLQDPNSDKIKATTTEDNILSRFRSVMGIGRGVLDSIAGGAGAELGGAGSTALGIGPVPGIVAGRAAGNVVADQGYQLLQHAAPVLFGGPPDNFKEGLKESLFNAGTDTFFSDAIPGVSKLIKTKLAQTAFKNNPLETEARSALAADTTLPVTAGQATGSKLAKTIENIFGGNKLHLMQAEQQGHLSKSAEQFIQDASKSGGVSLETPITDLAKISGSAIKQEAEKNKNIQNAFYNQLERVAVPNEKAVVAVPQNSGSSYWNLNTGWKNQYGNAEITGPIRLRYTLENAANISNDIDKVMKDPTNVFNPMSMEENNLIKKNVDEFRQSLPYDKDGNAVLSYDVAKALKTGKIDLLNGLSDERRNRLRGVVDNLTNSLSKDMHDSINGTTDAPALWSKAGADAYNRATSKFKDNLARFSPQIAKDLSDGADPDIIKSKVLNLALSSGEQMAQYKKALDPNATEPLTLLAQNILNKAKGADGLWDGLEGLKALKEYTEKGVTKEAFTDPKQLESFKYFLKRMQTVRPDTTNTGQVAVWMQGARAAANVAGPGLLTLAVTGSVPVAAGVAGTTLVALPWTKNIVQDFMLDPVNARKLAGIATSSPNSILARSTIKELFKKEFKSGALRGVFMDVMGQDGRPTGAKVSINENGDLVPVKN